MMNMIKTLVTLLLCLYLAPARATQQDAIREFVTGSYQQMLNQYADKAFVLVIWSVDCPSCLKDMELLHSVHSEHPEINMLMLSTDEPSAVPQIQKLLQDYQLSQLPSWVFADEDAQKLRYEIDPAWFGELPRTYFFNQRHERIGKSGALTKQQLLELSKP